MIRDILKQNGVLVILSVFIHFFNGVIALEPKLKFMDACKGQILEIGSLVIAGSTYLVPATIFDPKAKKTSVPPILLVHGYLHNSSAWHLFRLRLQKKYEGPIYTINLGHPFHSIEDYAAMIGHKISQISEDTGCSDIILIGHSMGGLVSCYYAANEPLIRVQKVITLGTPLQGTNVARIGIGQCASQMRLNHPFLIELVRKIKELRGTQFVHMGGTLDWIVSADSATLGCEKTDVSRHLYLYSIGHLSFLYSKKISDEVIRILNSETILK